MPFLEDVEEARERVAVLNTERIGEEIDAENAQDNEERIEIGDEVHPDFEVQHPDFFHEGNPKPATTVSSYRKIDLWDSNEIRMQIRKLDPDQRYILDLYVKYARCYKMAKEGFCMFPTPPLLVIEGDAGSGKSELIKVLCHVLEKEFRTAGDDPDQPYILKGSFTGEAARNIAGQTLTSLFQLGFGNNLGGLTDAMRDK